ncbi:hypothetical protein GCM10009109_10800 [Marinobacterium sediminicola]
MIVCCPISCAAPLTVMAAGIAEDGVTRPASFAFAGRSAMEGSPGCTFVASRIVAASGLAGASVTTAGLAGVVAAARVSACPLAVAVTPVGAVAARASAEVADTVCVDAEAATAASAGKAGLGIALSAA